MLIVCFNKRPTDEEPVPTKQKSLRSLVNNLHWPWPIIKENETLRIIDLWVRVLQVLHHNHHP